MVSPSLFEHWFSRATVLPQGQPFCDDVCVVDKGSLRAFPIQGAIRLVDAVAMRYVLQCSRLREDFSVMFCDDGFHVCGTAITNLQSVLVENLVVFVSSSEVLFNDFDEFPTNVCFNRCIVRGIEPYNFPCACASCALRWWLILDTFFKSAILQCFLVNVLHLVEFVCVARGTRYTLFDHS